MDHDDTCTSGVPWEQLPESSRTILLHVIRTLAGCGDGGRFTGRLTLHCNQGGTSSLTEERALGKNPDGSRSIEVHTFQADDLRRKAS